MPHTANAYGLSDVKRHYFKGEVSDTENGFRTLPSLLRRVADWMDAIDLQDPEFQGMTTTVEFPEGRATEPEEFYLTVTVHYASQAASASGAD